MTKRIAISLPDDLYERLECLRRERGAPRSLIIQEAVGEYLTDREREAKIEAYVRGYTENPETEEEIALAEAFLKASAEVLDEAYPWEGPSPWDEEAEGGQDEAG